MAVRTARTTAEPEVRVDAKAVEATIAPMLRRAMDAIGDRAVANIRKAISVPVEYTSGGGIIRSNPGQPPRMEEGELHSGIDYEVIGGDGLPELRVTAQRAGFGDDDAARVLEDGGLNGQGNYVAPRPFMRPEADEMRNYAVEMTREHLSGGKR
jgi:hypothetical protein